MYEDAGVYVWVDTGRPKMNFRCSSSVAIHLAFETASLTGLVLAE